MQYETLPVTPFMQNCRIVYCSTTKQAAVVDPGGNVSDIVDAIARLKVTVMQIWVTHAHIDHVGGAAELKHALNVPIMGSHRDDEPLMAGLAPSAAAYGMPMPQAYTPDRWLEEGDELTLGDMRFDVRHCPGHAPGHVIFINRAAGVMLAGDVLFKEGIGRTDLPGGNMAQLIASINTLWSLGDEMVVLSGHGEPTTLGHERCHNPFVGQPCA